MYFEVCSFGRRIDHLFCSAQHARLFLSLIHVCVCCVCCFFSSHFVVYDFFVFPTTSVFAALSGCAGMPACMSEGLSTGIYILVLYSISYQSQCESSSKCYIIMVVGWLCTVFLWTYLCVTLELHFTNYRISSAAITPPIFLLCWDRPGERKRRRASEQTIDYSHSFHTLRFVKELKIYDRY